MDNIKEIEITSVVSAASIENPNISDNTFKNFLSSKKIKELFTQHYDISIMAEQPTIEQCEEYQTVITPVGAFQLALENKSNEMKHLKCVASIAELTQINPKFLTITDSIDVETYDAVVEQLKQLEKTILYNQGHTLFGYSINEKLHILAVNKICRSESSYPPLPEALSRRTLSYIKQPIIQDIITALHLAAQINLLFDYFLQTYFHYTYGMDDDLYNDFRVNNVQWRLLGFGSIVLCSILLLQHTHKKIFLSKMEYLANIAQSIIGCAANLTNYGPEVVPSSVIESLFMPVLVLGAFLGYIQQKTRVTNIAIFPTGQFLFDIFFFALTIGSFCSLGLETPINDCFFLYSDDNPTVEKNFWRDASIARYSAFSLTLLFSLPRYPYASQPSQYLGLHACNAMKGVSSVLFSNYALTTLISLLFQIFSQEKFSSHKPGIPALFCTLNALSFVTMSIIVFANTPNIPIYSVEKEQNKHFLRLSKCQMGFYCAPKPSNDQQPSENSAVNNPLQNTL